MKNSEVFLSTYNQLDNYLRSKAGAVNHVSFASIVNQVAERKGVVKYYKKHLIEYNELRNAIVHERIDGRVIAEPNDDAVAEFKSIYDKISSPKSITEICRHEVKILEQTASLAEALNLMKTHDFSQIPIYNEHHFVCMLNSETIASWLSNHLTTGQKELSNTKIEEVIKYKTQYKKTLIQSRKTNIYDIIKLYKENVYDPVQIDAILITHSGKVTEKPITIITDEDIPCILKAY
ncbi:MAG: CBS domain-containing protein [Clostridia bacterium]|nr:CBS domain-containing protein [Clostridia bacterium]